MTQDETTDRAKMTPEDAKAAWGEASTFEDACELTALFIEGESPYTPGYAAPGVSEETSPLVPYLAGFNRGGLLTIQSQPGLIEPGYRQRAFVDGYARPETARRMVKLGLCTELIVLVYEAGQESDLAIPVTVDGFRMFTQIGGVSADQMELGMIADEMHPDAEQALDGLVSVQVFDPVWGRGDYLWEALAQELCYSDEPHPSRVDYDEEDEDDDEQ